MERSPKRITRQLRDRKERKFYTDDWVGDADDEIEGPQSFDLEEKLATTRFAKNLVKDMRGTEFTLAYIQENGFTEPLIFKEKTGLGIRIPGPNFSVGDVKTCVGSKRLLDVMDVKTQKNLEMTMKQWQEYYEKHAKDRLLNVISLEFSHTKLENYVESPTVVRQIDWVDRVWPRHLKNMQTESTNVMDEMMYPKVQKYCLMSVKGCFTDFHVDFGGTSVWYHILKGAKVFWLIPPTDKNLELYQSWVLSGKQGDTFFGDNVNECSRVYLSEGDTFFIPSGWIHAVYTPKDSLVFGGNFLHSFGIEKQLKIATVEEQTKVPQKFRYPFFTEMLWYTLERYVHCLLGTSFIRIPTDDDEDNAENSKLLETAGQKLVPDDVALSPQELLGLKAIVLYLHQLPILRKNVPALIYDPVALLRSVRTIVEEHRYDSPAKAVTGRPILVWPGEKAEDVGRVFEVSRKRPLKTHLSALHTDSGWCSSPSSQDGEPPRKRVRCGGCQSCTNSEDCNQCINCIHLSKPKEKEHHRKKPCVMRECLMPVLPVGAICVECGLDGWGEAVVSAVGSFKSRNSPSSLMECTLCLQIIHPHCIAAKLSFKTLGIINDDLPSSWECPVCIEKSKPPPKSKRVKSTEERRNSIENSTGNMNGPTNVKVNGTPSSSVAVANTNSMMTLNHVAKASFSDIANKMEFSTANAVKEEKEESTILIVPAPPKKHEKPAPKSKREDEKHVQQKLDQVVRRKSADEKTIAGKMNAALKRTMSTNSDLARSRRGSDEMPKLTISCPNAANGRKTPENPTTVTINSAKKFKKGKAKELDKEKELEKIKETKDKEKKEKDTEKVKEAKEKEKKEKERKEKEKKEKDTKELDKLKKEKEKEKEADKIIKKEKVLEMVEEIETTEEVARKASPIKYPFRTDLSGKIMSGSGKSLKKPSNVVRPATLNSVEDASQKKAPPKKKIDVGALLADKKIMLNIFSNLDLVSLNRCLSVSKDWNRIGLTPSLWERADLTNRKITAELLKGLVRRQPTSVSFNWTTISKQQLFWFISRLPQLKELSLQGLPWQSVSALKTCFCPALSGLDLGYVGGLTDAALREILAPPVDSRPGLADSKSRLRQLKCLCLAGAALSDVSLRYVTQHAGSICKLDLSCCSRITDAGIAQLGAPDSPSLENLTHLSISGCPQLTNISLDHLRRCKNMRFLNIRHIPQITLPGVNKFLGQVTIADGNTKLVVKSEYNCNNLGVNLHQPTPPTSNVQSPGINPVPGTNVGLTTANVVLGPPPPMTKPNAPGTAPQLLSRTDAN